MSLLPMMASLKHEVMCLRQELDDVKARIIILEDRMAVNEEHVIGHENRLQDLEEQYDKDD
jgi:hypothetical protein